MRAIWENTVIAESDETVVVEGNHYFPADAIKSEFFVASDHTTHCPWKGEASYYHVSVNGEQNPNAAWYYADPMPAAAEIKGRIAFWHGVVVES